MQKVDWENQAANKPTNGLAKNNDKQCGDNHTPSRTGKQPNAGGYVKTHHYVKDIPPTGARRVAGLL